jgi:hypothetical protein
LLVVWRHWALCIPWHWGACTILRPFWVNSRRSMKPARWHLKPLWVLGDEDPDTLLSIALLDMFSTGS